MGPGVEAGLASARAGSLGDGVPIPDPSVADDDSSLTNRFTPAAAAHRLTQLCGTQCFFAAPMTPIVRTSARTASCCLGGDLILIKD